MENLMQNIDRIYEREVEWIIFYDDYRICGIPIRKNTEDAKLVEVYLLDHPAALVTEPVSPPPSVEELRQRRRIEIVAALVSLDARTIRPLRAGETERVAELDAEAKTLREELAGLA